MPYHPRKGKMMMSSSLCSLKNTRETTMSIMMKRSMIMINKNLMEIRNNSNSITIVKKKTFNLPLMSKACMLQTRSQAIQKPSLNKITNRSSCFLWVKISMTLDHLVFNLTFKAKTWILQLTLNIRRILTNLSRCLIVVVHLSIAPCKTSTQTPLK